MESDIFVFTCAFVFICELHINNIVTLIFNTKSFRLIIQIHAERNIWCYKNIQIKIKILNYNDLLKLYN